VLVVLSVRIAYRNENPAPDAVHTAGLAKTSVKVPPVCHADVTDAAFPPVV
jgi:hypothetical protein